MEKFRCPVCESLTESSVFQCKDHSVSGELFEIYLCNNCLFASTSPQPASHDIIKYYKTEEYVSHSDTKKGIVNKMYHFVRKKNIKDKLLIVNEYSDNKGDLLDVGCGTGYFLYSCLENGWNIEGVEPSDDARAIAEMRVNRKIFSSTNEPENAGKTFDVITLWHVFEHMCDVNESLLQLKRLLKPEGIMILALPNHCSADAEHYGQHWAAYDVPRHLSHFSPKSLCLLAEKHGMELRKVIPMKYDSFYVSMLSEKIKGAGKIKSLVNGLKYGCLSNYRAKNNGNYSSLIYILQ